MGRDGRVEIAVLLVALAVVVLAVHGAGRPHRLPGAAAADRRRASRRRTSRACRRSTSSPRSCCSGCCRRCCTPPRSRPRWSTSTPTGAPILLLVGRAGGVHDVRRRRGRARADPRHLLAGRVRDRRGRRAAGRGRRDRDRRRIGLPRRIVTILEGESLLNDATALVALRTAIAAGVGRRRAACDVGAATSWSPRSAAALVGFVVFVVVAKLRKRITDPVLDTAISFVVPFATYIAAEEIARLRGGRASSSPACCSGHKAPILQTAQSRIAERMNWRTIAFFLENTVFLLIGLQASWILADVGDSDAARRPDRRGLRGRPWSRVIVLRMVWVFPARYLLVRPGPDPEHGRQPAVDRTRFLLGWAGHARRGHAGGGVRDPRGHRAPRGAAADRVHRRGRHAVHPGPVAAVAGAPAATCPHPTRWRTRWPGRRCCSRRPRPASSGSRSSSTTTRTASAT